MAGFNPANHRGRVSGRKRNFNGSRTLARWMAASVGGHDS
jgi:hypothetical protein